jgi:hypothetical protein
VEALPAVTVNSNNVPLSILIKDNTFCWNTGDNDERRQKDEDSFHSFASRNDA